jgi:multiple sugar transport system permease protein
MIAACDDGWAAGWPPPPELVSTLRIVMSLGSTTLGRAVRTAVPHIILIGFSASIFLPLLWLARVALTNKLAAYRIPPEWAPLRLDNFIEIFTRYNFANYFFNSMVAAIGSTVIALPLATAMAYAFARHNTGGSGVRLFILASQMLPPVILVLPMYSLFLMVGLINTWTGLVVAHLTINIPFLAWMLVAFFQGDVHQLEQAARVDGATRFQAFLRVAVPVAAPGLLAAGLLAFILSWNEFLFALILTGPTTATIPVALAGLQSQNGVEIAEISAGVVLAVVPLIIASRLIQRHLVRGLTFGAIK